MFSDLLSHARLRLARRSRYQRLVREINSLTSRDLADMRADRDTMLRDAYADVFGHR